MMELIEKQRDWEDDFFEIDDVLDDHDYMDRYEDEDDSDEDSFDDDLDD